ncbi:TldD/PmbA family protein [Henriciella aquimarina]|uniref:TldD/PmbA family protein n=1 Tax=Henriciella aquimarina TaxID=545261 RepID=UPI000A03B247|nr:TldD/PmbA family protein [Henriciella aquimarina]
MNSKFTTPPADILEKLIDRCLKEGATAADCSLGASEGVSVDVRDGKLEDVERSESQAIQLRVLFGQRQAHVSGSDLSDEAVSALAERCVAMAKAVPEDKYAGLASPELLAKDPPVLDLEGDGEIPLEKLEADAIAAEAAALGVEGVKTVAGCGNGWSRTERWVAASNGFASYLSGGSTGLGLAAVAERDGAMERDYDSWSVRKMADRPSPEEIGRTAGERAVARLGPRKVKTQKAAVLYDKRVASSLIGTFLSAISGPSVARGVSFLKDRLGEKVFADGINIIDDPFLAKALGCRNHDGEGLPVERKHLIEDGVLIDWLLNLSSAKQLGRQPNGFASGGFGNPPGVGTSNTHVEAGEKAPETLMKEAGKGLLVTDMFGPSINPNTGDYSVGVAGFWFEDGAVQYPVSEVTIAGDLPSMFARLIPASDLEFRGRLNAPSLLIEDMSIAGN